MQRDERYDTAVHESSHAVIACQLNVKFSKISINDDSNENHAGVTDYCKDEIFESGTKDPEYENQAREKWAKIALAGSIGEKELSPGSDWESHGRHDDYEAKKQLGLHLELDEVAEEKIRPIKKAVEHMIIQSQKHILSVARYLMESGELSYEDVKRIIDETPGPASKTVLKIDETKKRREDDENKITP